MSTKLCRLIVDREPQSGARNMAIDAALLTAADQSPALPIVRIYQWSVPTVTLGYFQKSEEATIDRAWAACPRVQRLTGGGAILHHHEITYSCVLPRTHALRDTPLRLYDLMHQAIQRVLMASGVTVGFRAELPQGPAEAAESAEPFLCFRRSDPRDLALRDSLPGQHPKVVGSAQRRRRGTILQHGSILLKASHLLPQIPGIADAEPGFDQQQFVRQLPVELGIAVADDVISSDYTDVELQLAFQGEGRQTIPNGP